jgi:nuclear pore complex protein Nup155
MSQMQKQCYELIFKALESIEELQTTGKVTKEDVMKMKESTLKRALTTEDELFHYTLYGYYIDNHWIEQLMQIHTIHLEKFLTLHKHKLQYADYLSRLYTRTNRFFNAAQLLTEVAHYPGLNLEKRMEYLTNALTNARSSSGSDAQELLAQIIDELDVARIQSDIIVALKKIPNTSQEIQELDNNLMDIGQVIFS